MLARFFALATAYFLPPGVRAERQAANRARMFLFSHLFGPFLGLTVPLVLYLLDPTPGADILLLAASIGGFWVFPFLMRAGVDYRTLVQLSVLNLHLAILSGCYNYGGINAPTVIWILIIPILCVFYTGGERSMNRRLLFVSLASFAIFFLLYNAFPPAETDLPDTATFGLGIVSTIATLCYVGMMAIYYARIFHAGADLENEVQRRRRLAVELRKAVVAANRASASKSEFLARTSHELRTPLNAIMGYAQLLKEEAEETADEALAADVDRILDAGEYLVRMINLILDLSKVEAGRMVLHLKPTDIGEIVTEVVDRRRDLIGERGNQVRLMLDSAPGAARVDGTQFRKAVDAIVENAAQHTENGTITIGSGRMLKEGREYFTVSIEDTGEGIAPDLLPSIMESLAMSRSASGGRYGGTGLSLTVANKLCQVMGGHIDVSSRPGRGSRFTIVLPLDAQTTEVPRPPGPDQDAPELARIR